MDSIRTPLFQELQSNIKIIKETPTTTSTIKVDQSKEVFDFLKDDAAVKRFSQHTSNKTRIHRLLQCCDQFPAISPDNPYLITWKIMIITIILFYFLELPVYVFFGSEVWSFMPIQAINTIGAITIFLFILDLFLEFQTAFFKGGNPVLKKSKIAINYFRGYFTFDLIAYFAFGMRIFMDTAGARWIYFLFYFKLPAFLKMDEHLHEILLLHRRSKLAFQILRIFALLICCMNFYCCIFYGIGKSCLNAGLHSWLTQNGPFGIIDDKPPHMIYFYSFYFSMATLSSTMGYGDITPQNPFECSWALVGMMFGIIVFVFNMQLIYDYAQEYSETYKQMTRNKIAIHRFMRDKQIAKTTKSRINQYLNEFWLEEGARDFESEQRVLEWLGPELKEQLLYEAYHHFLKKVPFFSHFSSKLLRELTTLVGELRLSKGERIIRDKENRNKSSEQETTNKLQLGKGWFDQEYLYYLHSGSATVHPNMENNKYELKHLYQGETFGEYSFITGMERQSAVTTTSYAHLYFIGRQDFLEIIQNFPEDYEIYCQLKDQVMFKSIETASLGMKCHTCNEIGHYATSCKWTHYQPDPLQLQERQTDTESQRQKAKRKPRKKIWRTRLDLNKFIQVKADKTEKTESEDFEQVENQDVNPLKDESEYSSGPSPPSQLLNNFDELKEYHHFFTKWNPSVVVENYNDSVMKNKMPKPKQNQTLQTGLGFYWNIQ